MSQCSSLHIHPHNCVTHDRSGLGSGTLHAFITKEERRHDVFGLQLSVNTLASVIEAPVPAEQCDNCKLAQISNADIIGNLAALQ